MGSNIPLTRPLVTLDIETTGLDILKDRIVEISFATMHPDGRVTVETRRVNPGIPIPPEATKVHGITDADVADAATFKQQAAEFWHYLHETDIATFNGDNFDIPLLVREFSEAGLPWDPVALGQFCIDVKALFTKFEPRRLVDAVRKYLGREHEGAHAAEADTLATLQVLQAMPAHYEPGTVPLTIAELAELSGNGKGRVDVAGKFYRDEEGDICLNFGQHRGKKAKDNFGYVQWMLTKGEFHPNTKEWCKRILAEDTATTAVISREHKDQILALLESPVITRPEKVKTLSFINTFSDTRAEECIAKLKKAIAERSRKQ